MDLNVFNKFISESAASLRDNVQGFVSVSLISLQDGTELFGLSKDGGNSHELASVFQLETYKSASKSVSLINNNSESNYIEEVIIKSEDRIYILISHPQAKYHMGCLVLDAKTSNLGLARILFARVRDAQKQLVDSDWKN